MNYGRGVQPSCGSRADYLAQDRTWWKRPEKELPSNGACVQVMTSDGTRDRDFWLMVSAVYFEGKFFEPMVRDGSLTYCEIDEPIVAWCWPMEPDWDLDD